MRYKMKVAACSFVAMIIATVLIIDHLSNQRSVLEKKVVFSKLVVLGDSDLDNGAAFEISKRVVESGNENAFIKPGELYWGNRYSNGKTAVEVAAEIEGLTLVNYATGGATSGLTNYTNWMDTFEDTGVLGQVEKYKNSLNNRSVGNDVLYFLSGGTNDYYRYMDYNEEGTLDDVATRVGENIEASVRELAGVGAEHILIAEVKDLGVLPCEIIEGRSESGKQFTKLANSVIKKKVKALKKELDINIHIFEWTQVTQDMMKHPNKYGMIHHLEVIQPTWPEVLEPQTERLDTYMYFDEWHPSEAHHQVLGEALAKQINEMQNKCKQ